MINDLNGEFSIFIGLDWANSKHDVCVQIGNSDTHSFYVIKHSPEAIDTWLKTLRDENKGNIAIAVELTKDPIVYALHITEV